MLKSRHFRKGMAAFVLTRFRLTVYFRLVKGT
jgi:hypothetical protein